MTSAETNVVTCQRCKRPGVEIRTLYIGLVLHVGEAALIPLQGLTLRGGTLEICPDCHSQWLAAIKTWFENPADYSPDRQGDSEQPDDTEGGFLLTEDGEPIATEDDDPIEREH